MIGENIKRFRIQKNLTQSELAKAIGVGLRTEQKYESNGISPPLDRLEQIADILEVDITQLIKKEKSYSEQFREKFNPNFMKSLLGFGSEQVPASIVEKAKNILLKQFPKEKLEELDSSNTEDYLMDFLEEKDVLNEGPFFVFHILLAAANEGKLNTDLPKEDLWFLIEVLISYNYHILENFYEDEYLPVVKDSKALIEITKTYEKHLSEAMSTISDLELQLKLERSKDKEYKELLDNKLESIYEKDIFTESDISKFKMDILYENSKERKMKKKY